MHTPTPHHPLPTHTRTPPTNPGTHPYIAPHLPTPTPAHPPYLPPLTATPTPAHPPHLPPHIPHTYPRTSPTPTPAHPPYLPPHIPHTYPRPLPPLPPHPTHLFTPLIQPDIADNISYPNTERVRRFIAQAYTASSASTSNIDVRILLGNVGTAFEVNIL